MRWARKVVMWGLLLGLAGVFGYAGVVKVLDPAGFALSVQRYRLLPGWAVEAVAWYLPWLEVVCAAGCVVGWGKARVRAASLGLITVMLVVFLVAIGSAWWRGLDIDCGCFGGSEASAGYAGLVLRDIGLLAAAGVVWWLSVGEDKPTDTC